MHLLRLTLIVSFFFFITPHTGADSGINLSSGNEASQASTDYEPSSKCRNCHFHIFDQHIQSMHAKSFSNPVFQAQYFDELVPLLDNNEALAEEASSCISCHAPIAYISGKGVIKSKDQVGHEMSGVTCDFCHTISGYKGERPECGNYISSPGPQKLGPFRHQTDWHHTYSELHTKSEFCAICHNVTNHNGLEIKSTYTEWKNSRYAEEDIQCQDCHMNVQGFLTGGKPVYESGEAAHATLIQPPYRLKLYTHRFPGANSRTQIEGAITLMVETEKQDILPGDEITVNVFVDNSRTGHKMPSGSADLRFMILELNAYARNRIVPATATSVIGTSGNDVTGKGEFDSKILGKDFSQGKRIYRSIFSDNAGHPTLSSYNAVKIIFDNRLEAGEIRKEKFYLKVPENALDKLPLIANLYYFSYPGYFAEQLGLPMSEPVVIGSARKYISITRNKTDR